MSCEVSRGNWSQQRSYHARQRATAALDESKQAARLHSTFDSLKQQIAEAERTLHELTTQQNKADFQHEMKLNLAQMKQGRNNVTGVGERLRRSTPSRWSISPRSLRELAVRAMQYSSRPGENVLDLFGGSRCTSIAAEQMGAIRY